MKTTGTCQYPEPIKGFHTVEFFRKIKRKISREIKDMTYEEVRAYLDKRVADITLAAAVFAIAVILPPRQHAADGQLLFAPAKFLRQAGFAKRHPRRVKFKFI